MAEQEKLNNNAYSVGPAAHANTPGARRIAEALERAAANYRAAVAEAKGDPAALAKAEKARTEAYERAMQSEKAAEAAEAAGNFSLSKKRKSRKSRKARKSRKSRKNNRR